MSVSSCIAEVHRTHGIKMRGLVDTKNKELRMAESDRKEKHKALEAEHKAEIANIWKWFREQRAEEDKYLDDAIAACKVKG